MVADTLKLKGSLTILPDPAVIGSGRSEIRAEILELLSVFPSFDTAYTLTSDAPQAVNLGGLTGANFVMLKGDQPFTAIYTSAAHAAKEVDGQFHLLISPTSPITALSLVRPGGVQTTVRVVLGQVSV